MADPIIISLRLVDDASRQASFPIYVPSTATLAQIQTTAEGYAELLDAASGCAVQAVGFVTLPLDLSGATLKGTPVADSNIGDGYNLVFNVDGSAYTYAVRLPYPIRTLVESGVLTVSAGAAKDLIDALIAGIDTDPDPTDESGRDITAFLRRKYSNRKVKDAS